MAIESWNFCRAICKLYIFLFYLNKMMLNYITDKKGVIIISFVEKELNILRNMRIIVGHPWPTESGRKLSMYMVRLPCTECQRSCSRRFDGIKN